MSKRTLADARAPERRRILIEKDLGICVPQDHFPLHIRQSWWSIETLNLQCRIAVYRLHCSISPRYHSSVPSLSLEHASRRRMVPFQDKISKRGPRNMYLVDANTRYFPLQRVAE